MKRGIPCSHVASVLRLRTYRFDQFIAPFYSEESVALAYGLSILSQPYRTNRVHSVNFTIPDIRTAPSRPRITRFQHASETTPSHS